MRFGYVINLTPLLFICAIFFSQGSFAQDLNAIKSEIYSKIKCCACNEPFEICACPEAKEMRTYLEALLDTGLSKEGVFYKFAKRFSLNAIIDEKIRQEVEKKMIKEAGQTRPQIILDSAAYDFGMVSKKQGKISKIFKLSNKGNAPLVIKSLKTSCPCALVALKINKNKSPYFGTKGSAPNWQAELKPGQSASIELMLDLTSPYVKAGKIVRAVTISSNDPLYPEQIVRVEAEVKE